MKKQIALFCSGQGHQHPKMFELVFKKTIIRDQVNEWLKLTGLKQPLEQLLNDKSLLFSNQIAQPLIVASTLAYWEALKSLIPTPVLVAGYSVGEVSAYGISGMLTSGEAVKLAAERAICMNASLTFNPSQGLLGVSNVYRKDLACLLKQHHVSIAIDNTPNYVVGGLMENLKALETELLQIGAQLRWLPIQVASHTYVMQPVVPAFIQLLEYYHFTEANYPVVASVTAEVVTREKQAKALLARQLVETIHWSDCMEMCKEFGIHAILELGPGAALSHMMHERYPHIACRSVSDFKTLEGIADWVTAQDYTSI